MASLNINYLLKDELSYEILSRNQDPSDKSTDQLRKLLREIIHIEPSISNLSGKLGLQDEMANINTKLGLLEVLIENTRETTSNLSIIKIKAKLVHLSNRIAMLKKCKIEDPNKISLVETYEAKILELRSKFEELQNQVDKVTLDNFETELNKSLLEDEQENDRLRKFESLNVASTPKENTTNFELQKSEAIGPIQCENLHQIPVQTQMSPYTSIPTSNQIFNKIQNPIENYLMKFEITNGLETTKLLKFLNRVHELRNLNSLTEQQILEIIPSYTAYPLLNKILEGKTQKLNLDQIHEVILNTFIPQNLREKLKQDLIYRPQMPQEELQIYIQSIKTNNAILKANINEQNLIEIIINGINPHIRNSLVFQSIPKNFIDLDRLCIHLNNIQYSDFMRNQHQYLQNHAPHSLNLNYLRNNSNPNPRNNSTMYQPSNYFMPQYALPYKPINYTMQDPTSAHYNPNPRRPREYNPNPQEKICFNCNRKGHLKKDCYRPKNNLKFSQNQKNL